MAKYFRDISNIFEKNKLWIIAIIALDIFFGVLLWLLDDEKFIYIFSTMILGSLILYTAISFLLYREYMKKKLLFEVFLEDPSLDNEVKIIGAFNKTESKFIKKIGEILRENKVNIIKKTREIDEYEEYIESWAHEIKTPLGLMTFVLDNRKEEMSKTVYKRLEYTRTKMQEDIEKMLYYSRLKANGSDYLIVKLSLKCILKEVLEEYEILLQEQEIELIEKIEDYTIISDKKGVKFIIRQIISNSIKYKKSCLENPKIIIRTIKDKKEIKLIIRDNGIGVKPFDLPFIFEKGFTGEIGEQRKNSTGMGLYLSGQVAKSLNILIEPSETYIDGFEVSLLFPLI